MRYFLAIILPPLAVFLCGKPIQGILNIILTLLFWVPGIVHALFVVHNHLADKRNQELVDAIKSQEKSQ
ncbi:YqaE/Pmp3 family membrane protein [Parendozoicomonas callyspongiae]|uniref:YqaE/Pmp3 family membrane protein n=1 Tax=Parendozoicomonas callyspongiae TaxID=2942213 RepID=UPI0038CDB3D4